MGPAASHRTIHRLYGYVLATDTFEYLTYQQHRPRLNSRIIPSLKKTTEPLGGKLRDVLNSDVS